MINISRAPDFTVGDWHFYIKEMKQFYAISHNWFDIIFIENNLMWVRSDGELMLYGNEQSDQYDVNLAFFDFCFDSSVIEELSKTDSIYNY